MNFQIEAITYRLQFKHAFGLSHGSRNGTDTVYVRIKHKEFTGYGEVALPPYLGYDAANLASVINNESAIIFHCNSIPECLTALHQSQLQIPARTAIDIALHDLYGKMNNKSIASILNIPSHEAPCMYTLGVSTPDDLQEKLAEAPYFKLYKLKLDGHTDRERILAFRKNTDAAFCADANKGWSSVETALTEIKWLKDHGCIFIEQPLDVDHPGMKDLHEKSPLPVYLDESVQQFDDILRLKYCCSGINIKLVKCGGLQPAIQMIKEAKRLNLKILIGCMSESSCGAAAASQLMGYADFIDLDGPLLISNDPFDGVYYDMDQLKPEHKSGHGANPRSSALWN